jgi:Activator of Hsp90 ATPase homolog 1-like protein
MTRTDSASRVIHADPERVFAALVDPQALKEWLPPSGMTGRFVRFDARPGRSYRLVLTHNDGSLGSGKATVDSDIVEARFIEIVPNVARRVPPALARTTVRRTWSAIRERAVSDRLCGGSTPQTPLAR